MASSSSHSGRKRKKNEELLALPAPKRSPVTPRQQRDVLALPAPTTAGRPRSLFQESGERLFELNVLLPDGNHVVLHEKVDDGLTGEELTAKVRRRAGKGNAVIWGPHVYLEDADGKIVEDGHFFDCDEHCRILFLQDGGQHSVFSLQDMWNVTPDPELLVSLPQEYTVETALADLLDNSLQAVWANSPGDRRIISVRLAPKKITIFDSGPGMDSTQENSIAKWGTMGSSRHRSLRVSAIGGKPPFLQPFFGMYGFGGLTAAMHLGSVVAVSSKTKLSKKVVSLTLEKEKLMERCKADRAWKTAGEYREPTEEEIRRSPHGSFTKVELSKLKKESVWTEKQVMCMLKDIYFPYIQCDAADSSQGTITPVEFEVNGTNLTEVDGGEVALTNMCSCNGEPFVLDIHMNRTTQYSDPSLVNDLDRATARLSCFYFPIKAGNETIDNLLEELHDGGIGIKETFDNFCRVSIRRLGRLLPDARWGRLPFMEPKRKRGDNNTPKICFERVKACIDTDAGFIPTTSKMDLLSGHIFTSFLKNLGTRGKIPEDVKYEIYRGTRRIKLHEAEKEYEDWLHEMHDVYDEEVEVENEQCTIAMGKADELGFSQDVYRIYTSMNRKGAMWKQGMRIRFLKGTSGHKTKDFYATLEYFVSEGLFEDKGSTKVICRPMEIAKDEGSKVLIENESVRIELRKSKALPIDFLTLSEKCDIVSERDWVRVYENKQLKEPGDIEILDKKIVESLGLKGGVASVVKAGVKPFDYVYAVIRPKNFSKLLQEGKSLNPIEQKNILKTPMQMKMQLKRRYTSNVRNLDNTNKDDFDIGNASTCTPQSIKNIHGFYCFSLESTDFGRFYTKAGKYLLTFSVMDEESENIILEDSIPIDVMPSEKTCKWILKDLNSLDIISARVGSTIGPLLVHCLDEYDNQKDINWSCDSSFEIWSGGKRLEISLLLDQIIQPENKKTSLIIEVIKLSGGTLQGISEDYSADLVLIVAGKSEASLNIRVLPGETSSVRVLSMDDMDNCLQTGDIIHILTLEVMDTFGNHVERGCKVGFELENLEFQDSQGSSRMVEDNGCVKLGGLLKVTGPFNGKASVCAYTENKKVIYFHEFFLKRRQLQVVSEIPEECATGGILHDVAIEVVDENGRIDKNMTAAHDLLVVRGTEHGAYPLKEGTCCIDSVHVSDQPGSWCVFINHVLYPELEVQIKVNLVENFERSISSLDYIESNEETTPLVNEESCSYKELLSVTQGLEQHLQVLKKKMAHCLQKLKKAEDELERMKEHKKIEEDKISKLEGEIDSLHRQYEDLQKSSQNGHEINDITAGKVAEEISRTKSPAKFILDAFCSNFFTSANTGDTQLADIIGIVCLLASAKNETLSRGIADAIGEDSMLGVVCKTRDAANLLIRLNKFDGSIDETCGLYEYVRSEKQNIEGKLRIFILEEIECYDGEVDESHPQKLLKIDAPKMSNGCVPVGFLGFAVNLLQLNEEHLQLPSGDEDQSTSLRGSLFYSLLKQLQIYDTRKNLNQAKDVLTTGGISLDGGVIRDKGCEDYGHWQKTKILFPLHSKSHGGKIPSFTSLNSMTQRMQNRDALREQTHDLQECKVLFEQINCKIDFIQRKKKSRLEKFYSLKSEMQKLKEQLTQLNKVQVV